MFGYFYFDLKGRFFMNNNKFSKIFAIPFVFMIFILSCVSVKAVPVEFILNKLQGEKNRLPSDSRMYYEEILNPDISGLKEKIKQSAMYQDFISRCRKKVTEDSIIFVFLFKYIREFDFLKSCKKSEECKSEIIHKILSMRDKEERRSDKFTAKEIDKSLCIDLTVHYKALEMD